MGGKCRDRWEVCSFCSRYLRESPKAGPGAPVAFRGMRAAICSQCVIAAARILLERAAAGNSLQAKDVNSYD